MAPHSSTLAWKLPWTVATHSSMLAWKLPWTEEPGRLQSMGPWRSDTTERLHFHFSLWCIGEGNGNPLQCSCLENPREVGETGGLPSMGSHRVGHDWNDLVAAAAEGSTELGFKLRRYISGCLPMTTKLTDGHYLSNQGDAVFFFKPHPFKKKSEHLQTSIRLSPKSSIWL